MSNRSPTKCTICNELMEVTATGAERCQNPACPLGPAPGRGPGP